MGKPFPRRVIITVLDALFDLFARAHRAGVLWNDVKLDHIYWHNPTGDVSVIDWGNAVFLEAQNDDSRPALPRWEDYQQLVDTLGSFLKHSAPELFTDLGWDEFQAQELDLPRVSVLARRIAYQQQVVSLREMEYQSLIRVILSHEPTLEGLQKIYTYQQLLEQIGAPWQREKILAYAQNLIETSAIENDLRSSVQATTLVWELFEEDLDLSWYLLREYFRNPDLLTHSSIAPLVSQTLHENWSGALWTLVGMAKTLGAPSWWAQLVPVLRQKALGLVIEAPFQLCQSVANWMINQESHNIDQSQELFTILDHWRDKGEDLKESPFDYHFLDIINEITNLPRRTSIELKQSFTVGKEAIRQLLQVWVDMNWEELPKALRDLLSWDPDRWALLSLSQHFDTFQSWLMRLFSCPDPGSNIPQFLQKMLEQRPPIENVMGRPPWFMALMNMLTAILDGAPIAHYRVEVRNWCPWLLDYASIRQGQADALQLDEVALHEILLHYAKHLKSWSDLEAGLKRIKEKAPEYYPTCKRLLEGFEILLTLNFNPEDMVIKCQEPIHPALKESCGVLATLLEWRLAVNNNNLETAVQKLVNEPHQEWVILSYALKETEKWHQTILPSLQALTQFSASGLDLMKGDPLLVLEFINELRVIWDQISRMGLQPTLMEALGQTIESAHEGLLNWRQSFEHSNDRVALLLYQSHLRLIRLVTDCLLKLTQHSRQAIFSFKILSKSEDMPSANKMNLFENILDHMGAIEELLISDFDERRFPGWQNALKQYRDTHDPEERREMVLSLPEEHPLYGWLIQSQFA